MRSEDGRGNNREVYEWCINAFNPSCFSEHTTFISCLMFSWQNKQPTTKKNPPAVSFHRLFFGGLIATTSLQLRTLKTLRFSGCGVGFTAILTSNSCPVDGWRLGRGAKWRSSQTWKEQKETLYAAWATCTRPIGPGGRGLVFMPTSSGVSRTNSTTWNDRAGKTHLCVLQAWALSFCVTHTNTTSHTVSKRAHGTPSRGRIYRAIKEFHF